MIQLILEGLLLLAILAILTDADFEIGFWPFLKVGLSILAFKVTAIVIGGVLSSIIHPLFALVVGLVVSGGILGWFIARQYQLDQPKATIGVGVFVVCSIAINVGFYWFLGAEAAS